MRKRETAEWFFGSLRYIQTLICRIEIIYAIFIVIDVLLEGASSQSLVLFTLACYILLNVFVGWSGAAPNLAELLANLGMCSILTLTGAGYSSILYHLLLIRTTMRSDRERASRIAVLISLVFLASSIFHTDMIDRRYALNMMFNFMGLGILSFATMYVRSLVLKQVTTDVRVKELIKQNDYNHHMAITDRLTGLYNYRGYVEKVDNIAQCVLLLIDIDYFKKFNDTYGHLFGDRVLAALGQIIKIGLRKDDLAFRYGGEEFVIVLPQTSLQVGYKVAERLRERVAKYQFRCNDIIVPITISVGMTVKIPCMDARQVFEQADSALYCAKNHGRNNVQLFDKVEEAKGIHGC
jgi:diguanylate cyclase (GGDEF)-like protein